MTCDTQQDIDHYWDKLGESGEFSACGWLKDKFGLSWQVTPAVLSEMLSDSDQVKIQRVTNAFLQMKRLDIAKLKKAFSGE